MTSTITKAYTIGGTRNIGYYTSLRLLRKGATVTFLVRNASCFDNNVDIQEFVKKGKVRIVKGDALVKEDVRKGWEIAGQTVSNSSPELDGKVDVLLFTVGGYPSFHLNGGFLLDPPDLCSHSLLNALSTMPRTHAPPRIVVLTSSGLTRESHATLPFAVRLIYRGIRHPHADKLGAERLLAYVLGQPEPEEHVLPANWKETEGLPGKGELKRVVIMRPALLTDGACREKYRIRSEGDLALPGGYTVSRQDVAHFIAERLLGDEWDTFEGKGVNMAY